MHVFDRCRPAASSRLCWASAASIWLRLCSNGASQSAALLPAAAAPIALCSTRPTPSEREALRDRAEREARLQQYVQTEALQLYARHCKGAERSQRCAETRRAIEDAAHALAHPGTTAGAMRHYHARHGCTRCTPEAVAACAEFPRIVEIGAGRGHWARALRDAGVAVEAYDDGSALPGRGAAVHPVVRGDGLAAVRARPDAALLLVFPPPTPMAVNALEAFEGRVVLYAGEPRGGANGNDAFFDALDARYYVAATVALDPFPGGVEKLFVLRRRRRWWWSFWY